MPLYDYRCLECQKLTTAYRSVAKRDESPECEHCGAQTKKIISNYFVVGDLEPYYDDNLQTHIRGKQHRKRVMEEQGVSEKFGAGWYTSAKKHRKTG